MILKNDILAAYFHHNISNIMWKKTPSGFLIPPSEFPFDFLCVKTRKHGMQDLQNVKRINIQKAY